MSLFNNSRSVIWTACSVLLLVLPLSCRKKVVNEERTVPLVRSILSDKTSYIFKLLSAYDASDRSKTIFIVGDSEDCSYFSKQFVNYDIHDNVDGRRIADGLPDFSGERIVSLVDAAYFPYDSLLNTDDGRTEFRELCVRNVVAAIDTACALSPYDMDGFGHKSFPKILVMAPSAAAEYGMFDVDSLMSATGCHLPILNPFGMIKDEISARHKDPVIGVIAKRGFKDLGVYRGCYASERTDKHDASVLFSFLDEYAASDNPRPLDALVIDDYSISGQDLTLDLEIILSVLNEESMIYSKLIAPGFRIYDCGQFVTEKCFGMLRENNLFTHNISFPATSALMAVKSAADGSYTLIEYNEKFFPKQ